MRSVGKNAGRMPALPRRDNTLLRADMGRSVLRPYMFVCEIWDWMRLTVGVGATRIGEYPSD